ncbi:MAG: hypothetical protein ACT4PP_00960 [Sporichthyaceae bacterium]
MPRQAPSGYTAFACTGPSCESLCGQVFAPLRACVRAGMHGVLVSTGCSLGPLMCRTRTPGTVVIVQPCDEARRPIDAAMVIGPLRDDLDVDELRRWLEKGTLEFGLLPARLRAVSRAAELALVN